MYTESVCFACPFLHRDGLAPTTSPSPAKCSLRMPARGGGGAAFHTPCRAPPPTARRVPPTDTSNLHQVGAQGPTNAGRDEPANHAQQGVRHTTSLQSWTCCIPDCPLGHKRRQQSTSPTQPSVKLAPPAFHTEHMSQHGPNREDPDGLANERFRFREGGWERRNPLPLPAPPRSPEGRRGGELQTSPGSPVTDVVTSCTGEERRKTARPAG